jgi:hypothetical protein
MTIEEEKMPQERLQMTIEEEKMPQERLQMTLEEEKMPQERLQMRRRVQDEEIYARRRAHKSPTGALHSGVSGPPCPTC